MCIRDRHLRRRGALRRFIRAALQHLHGEGVRPRGLRGLRAPWGGGHFMLTGAGLHGSAVSGVSRPSSQRGGAVAEVVHARGALALIRRGGGAARKTEGCAVGALPASLLTGYCCGRPRPRRATRSSVAIACVPACANGGPRPMLKGSAPPADRSLIFLIWF